MWEKERNKNNNSYLPHVYYLLGYSTELNTLNINCESWEKCFEVGNIIIIIPFLARQTQGTSNSITFPRSHCWWVKQPENDKGSHWTLDFMLSGQTILPVFSDIYTKKCPLKFSPLLASGKRIMHFLQSFSVVLICFKST